MKKLLSIILAVLMCVLPLATSVGAAAVADGNNAAYELGSVAGFPGDTINIPVAITTGANADSFSFNGLTYDEDAFEFVGFANINNYGALLKKFDESKATFILGYEEARSFDEDVVCEIQLKIKDTASIDEYEITGVPTVKAKSVVFDSVLIPTTVTVKGKDFSKDITFRNGSYTYDGENKSLEVDLGDNEGIDGIDVKYIYDDADFTGATDAGVYEIAAEITAPGYNKVVKEATLTIKQKDVTVTGKISDKEYDGTTDGTWEEIPTLVGAVSGDDVDITYATENQFAKKNVGTKITVNNGVELVGEDADNYNLKTVDINKTAKITARAIEVTIDNKSVRVGGEMPELTYEVTKGSLVEGDALTGALATTAKNTNTVKNYPITKGTLSAGSNYAVTFVNGTLSVIDKEAQVVDVAAVDAKTYGDESFELVVTEGTGTDNDVTFNSLAGAVATVDENGKVTIVGAGTAKIEVAKAGDDTYADFAQVVTFNVAKKQITITAHNKTAMIGDAIPEFTYDVDGLVNGDILTGKLATTAKNTNTENNYPINQGTLKASDNYTVVFNAGTFSVIDKLLQNVVVTPNAPSSITYGDEGFTIGVALGEPATDSVVTFASDNEAVATVDNDGNVAIVGAGKANITVAKVGDDLYADFSQVIALDVAKVEITVNAKDNGKRVDGAEPKLTYNYTGTLVGADAFTGELTRKPGETVGTYDILQGTLALNANYNITYNKATFTIYDKTPQTITVNPVGEKTYGDAVFQLGVNLGDAFNADAATTYASSNEAVVTVADDGKVTIVGAGSAKITVAREGNADLANFSTNVNITVAKKAITVKADAKEKYVGQETPKLTYAVEGTLVGDDVFTGALTVSDGNKAGKSYDIKLGTLSLGDNYKITYVGAKLSVLAKLDQDLTLTAPSSAVYGQTGHKAQVTLPEVYNTDAEVVFASSNENVATIDADGSITIKGVGKTTISAALEANYKFSEGKDTQLLTVTKREITITANDASKKIGNADPDEFTYTLTDSGASLSEDVFISFGPLSGEGGIGLEDVVIKREAGEDVGTYDIEIESYTLPGEENYDVTLRKGTFTIYDKEPQTITGVDSTYDKIFGDEDFTLAPASAELPETTFTYASDNDTVVTVAQDGTAAIVGAGEANITITAAGDADYAATTFKTAVTVAPKTVLASDITIDLENGTANVAGADGISVDFTKLTLVLGAYDDTTANVTVSNIVLTDDGVAKAANYVVEEGASVETTVPVSMLAAVTVVIPEEMAEQGTAEGAGTYLKGTEVTLTAVPAKNYKVAQWAQGETKLGTAKTYKFTVEEDIEITLTFKKNAGGGGVGSTDKTENESNKPADPVEPVDPVDPVEPVDPVDPVEPDDNKENEENKVEWKGDDHYGDIKTSDWYFEAVKKVTELGLMNGVEEKEFAPEETLTRAMLITVLYRFDGEAEIDSETVFEDVNVDDYYGKALAWATENDIVNGISETEFAPNEDISREQMATILFRYAAFKGMEAVNMAENLEGFADADEISEYAVSAFNWAVGAGLFNGRDGGTLAPLDGLTRAEAATLIVRFSKLGLFAE